MTRQQPGNAASLRQPVSQPVRKDLPPVRPQPDEAPAQRGGAGTVAPVRTQDGRGADQSKPTPPKIVANADEPVGALAAFIAQELEHWGFDCESRTPAADLLDDKRRLHVIGPNIVLSVEVGRVV